MINFRQRVAAASFTIAYTNTAHQTMNMSIESSIDETEIGTNIGFDVLPL